jgi:hypothetical protein
VFHIPAGTLVVPSSLPDLHAVVDASGLVPVAASNLPQLTARAKLGTTTVVVGRPAELEVALRVWGSAPVWFVGDRDLRLPRPFRGVSVPSDAPLSFLTTTAVMTDKAFVVGDVHNCHRTLRDLLEELHVVPSAPRVDDPLLVFVGDLVDKGGAGPQDMIATLALARQLRDHGQAVIVRGNHEQMLLRRYRNQSPTPSEVQSTVDALALDPDADALVRMLDATPLALRLPACESLPVTVAHATATEMAFGAGTRAQRLAEQSCLFGRSTTAPVSGIVVHGHWEVTSATCTRRGDQLLVNVDTGAYLGNKLTAFDASTLPSTTHCTTVSVPTNPGDLLIRE